MVAVAIGGAGLLTAGASIIGSSNAASAQENAANTAAQTQLKMYDQTRSDLLPYNQGGQTAFNNLSSLLGMNGQANTQGMLSSLQNYPGYQFALQQGGQAVDRSAASKGLMLSGGQLKDLTAYGQGMGSQLFNTYFNQNAGLANLGENAAAQTGNAGSAAANGAANAQLQGGQAAASGIAGMTNGVNQGINSALQGYLLNQSPYPSQGGQVSGDFNSTDLSLVP